MAARSAPIHSAATPRRGRKYFTLEEANRSLPYVSRIVADITDCYRGAVDIREHIEHPHPEDDLDDLKLRYERHMDRLNDLIDELHQVGVELKDFEKGLLDFPGIHEGREIYYCWHRGEQCVCTWHEVFTGYAGRQSVTLLERTSDAA